MLAATILTISITLQQGPPDQQQSLADQAALVSSDLDIFVQIEEVAALVESLESYQISNVLRHTLDETELGRAWNALVNDSSSSETQLLDDLLGQRFALALQTDDEDDVIDWVIVTVVEPQSARRLFSQFKFRELAPIHGFAVRSLPTHSLMMARVDEQMYIGPLDGADNSLFAKSLAIRADENTPDFANDAAMRSISKKLNKLEGFHNIATMSDAVVFLRHSAALGGESIICATLDDDTIETSHYANFHNSPLEDVPPPTTINQSGLARIADSQLITFARPMTVPTGQLATFIRAQMPVGAISGEMLDSVGERFAVFVGKGQIDQNQHEALAATLAIEVQSSDHALADLDALVWGFATFLEDVSEVKLNLPGRESLQAIDADAIRQISVGPAVEALFPATGLDEFTLHWTVDTTDARHGWWLVSSSADHLDDIGRALAADFANRPHDDPLTVELGFANPSRLANHWSVIKRPLLRVAEDDNERSDIEQAIEFVTDMSRCIDHITWQLDTPGHEQLQSTWTIRLIPRDHDN